MDTPWIIHGLSTDNPWIIHGYPWVIHGHQRILFDYAADYSHNLKVVLIVHRLFFHDIEVPSGVPRRNFQGPLSPIWMFLLAAFLFGV